MPAVSLTFSQVSFAYPGQAEPVFSDVSATLASGWAGVVGDNGCGKSTLGRLACRLLAPSSGSVTGPVARPTCVFCEQETERAPEALVDFALDFGREARRLRAALNLSDEMCWRYDQLSVGERKKLQVAVAFWRHPDVLVLDEPTNHVDERCRAELTRACEGFSGIGLLISHDRALLDVLAERCVCFEAAGVVTRPGGYTQAHEQAGVERVAAVREREDARRELARLSAEAERRRQVAGRSDARLSKRSVDAKDHDAKRKIGLARYTGKDAGVARQAVIMSGRAEAARRRLDEARVERRYDGDLWLEACPRPRKVLVRLEEGRIACGPDGAVLRVPSLALGNTDHLGIEGPNGAGKSTFVRHLAAHLAEDVPALVMPQELGRVEKDALLARVARLGAAELGRALSLVAQLNTDARRLRATLASGSEPSPGELRKLMLALAALDGVCALVMDEPTNHLDVHSVEALERALAAFPGMLVLVSHDAAFVGATCTRRLHVEAGEAREVLV